MSNRTSLHSQILSKNEALTTQSERQFNSRSTTDAFEEIYTNADIAVNQSFNENTGYLFDYPIRWLQDASMNKRIAIRRLDVIPSSHTFWIKVTTYDHTNKVEIDAAPFKFEYRCDDNLLTILSHFCNSINASFKIGRTDDKNVNFEFDYRSDKNTLTLYYVDKDGYIGSFKLEDIVVTGVQTSGIEELLKILNQDVTTENKNKFNVQTAKLEFTNVWSRDRLYFHSSFSTSHRQFIGKNKDFYQALTLLYPPPTNESTFYIKFTSDGSKPILIKHSTFDIQLSFITNYVNATII